MTREGGETVSMVSPEPHMDGESPRCRRQQRSDTYIAEASRGCWVVGHRMVPVLVQSGHHIVVGQIEAGVPVDL
jgi:hypothetical protein